MGKHRPHKLRDRRTGASPYAKKQKRPYKYGVTVQVDATLADQPAPRRGKDHVQASMFRSRT